MLAFVVLGLVFFLPSPEIGLGKRLRIDLFCVEWIIKPLVDQSIAMSFAFTGLGLGGSYPIVAIAPSRMIGTWVFRSACYASLYYSRGHSFINVARSIS